ncbi:hypothetical protein ACHAWT_006921 [Skeletonema menzelii]
MSHSSSATVSLSTTQPLSDILPWGSPLSVVDQSNDDATTKNTTQCNTHNRTLLITDSTSADGRFMLHTLALQFLSSQYVPSNNSTATIEGAVLWITLSPLSERQVVMALRKGMQHNLGGGGGGNVAVGGSSTIGNPSSSASTSGRIHVVSVPLEVADAALQDDDNEDSQPDFSHETYLKQLHQRIVHWLNHRELVTPSQLQQTQQQTQQRNQSPSMGPNLVIIDNGTMLSTIFGDTLSNAFISSVRATLKNHSRKLSTAAGATAGRDNLPTTIVNTTNLLTIRTSSPDDGGLYQLSDEDNVMKGEKLRSEYSRLLRPWLGMGSGPSSGVETNIVQMEEQSNYLSLSSNSTVPSMVYRCGLYELADGIVDISPLESGYARDVLGRLSFVTTWSGKGWWGGSSSSLGVAAAGVKSGVVGGSGIGSSSRGGSNKDDVNGIYSSICVNYRCDDSGVRVMRLRSR